jgi:hypothetical protein
MRFDPGSGGIVVNDGSIDMNFRVESNNNANAIFVDGGTDSVTIGAAGVTHFLGGIAVASENNSIFMSDSDIMDTSDTAAFDTVYGWTAGNALTTGDSNTLIGYAAGTAITTGQGNIMIGESAGDGFDTEGNNLGVGNGALGGASLSGGEFNVAIGNLSLDALTSGDNNTALGYEAGTALTTGVDNTILGFNSAKTLTTASFNTILGADACDTGTMTGNNNTVVGFQAARALTSAVENVIIGSSAGVSLTTGGYNVLIGRQAGDGYDAETHNLAIGVSALGGPVDGGEFNVAVGNYSLDALTSADGNTALGYNAGSSVTTGGLNTFIGHQAGQDTVALTTGTGNTVIGNNARTSANNAENQIVIGNDLAGAGDNRVTLGSSGGTINCSYTANNTWTQSSDKRLKKNINEDNLGLNFINELKPVTFNWKPKSEIEPEFQATRLNKGEKDTETLIHGLIAQDVKKAMDKVGNDTFNGWSESADGQEISREMFITPLIKAVQELSAQVTTLQNEVNTLKGE